MTSHLWGRSVRLTSTILQVADVAKLVDFMQHCSPELCKSSIKYQHFH